VSINLFNWQAHSLGALSASPLINCLRGVTVQAKPDEETPQEYGAQADPPLLSTCVPIRAIPPANPQPASTHAFHHIIRPTLTPTMFDSCAARPQVRPRASLPALAPTHTRFQMQRSGSSSHPSEVAWAVSRYIQAYSSEAEAPPTIACAPIRATLPVDPLAWSTHASLKRSRPPHRAPPIDGCASQQRMRQRELPPAL